jgi:cation:H+ antiporter
MSDRLVGLTIVAVGTSLPELAASVIAAARGHSDIAIGNVVGSNIFNVLLCLGAAAVAGDVSAPLRSVAVDVVALAAITLVAALFLLGKTIARWQGGLLVAGYASFVAYLVWQ